MPKKMYMLVQWVKKPHEVTVMEENENASRKNEVDIIDIEYPNKGIFHATLLQRSGKNYYILLLFNLILLIFILIYL